MDSDLIDNINKKDAFLEKHVFYGLKDLNDGFDYRNNQYFSEKDFEVVLERVKSLGLGIYGIEPWLDGCFYDCEVFECHTSDPTDSSWYMNCFDNFKKRGDNIVYSATYHIPENLYSE